MVWSVFSKRGSNNTSQPKEEAAPAPNNKKQPPQTAVTKLEQERERQSQIITQELEALQLANELQFEQMTQRGLIAKNQRSKSETSSAGDQVNDAASCSSDENDDNDEDEEDREKGYLQMAKEGYQQLVDAIIRPPRCRYKLSDLGPQRFSFGGKQFQRNDYSLLTERGYYIQVSQWGPDDTPTTTTTRKNSNPSPRPIVIYLHGNASARLEVLPQLTSLLVLGINVVALDFTGSGQSEGDYVSLGYYERHDLAAVCTHLRRASPSMPPQIALWGRSMGATTALMYASLHDHADDLACLVLDSSFASLVQLAQELVDKARSQGAIVPSMVESAALQMIQWSVQKHAHFNIHDVNPLRDIATLGDAPEDAANYRERAPPALFVHGDEDDFIKPHHSQDLCEAYPEGAQKSILLVEGHHNSPRPDNCLLVCGAFLERYLTILDEWKIEERYITTHVMYPPWYHRPPRGEKPAPVFLVPDDGAVAGFDTGNMGMTQDRQEDIQTGIHQVLGSGGATAQTPERLSSSSYDSHEKTNDRVAATCLVYHGASSSSPTGGIGDHHFDENSSDEESVNNKPIFNVQDSESIEIRGIFSQTPTNSYSQDESDQKNSATNKNEKGPQSPTVSPLETSISGTDIQSSPAPESSVSEDENNASTDPTPDDSPKVDLNNNHDDSDDDSAGFGAPMG